ncbi:hypothetical protein B0H12DRAFT_1230752 [Mycena haematopus]|nr:hypothetical protein B0H12DRAFT_1230752 [Mycena haematopus]
MAATDANDSATNDPRPKRSHKKKIKVEPDAPPPKKPNKKTNEEVDIGDTVAENSAKTKNTSKRKRNDDDNPTPDDVIPATQPKKKARMVALQSTPTMRPSKKRTVHFDSPSPACLLAAPHSMLPLHRPLTPQRWSLTPSPPPHCRRLRINAHTLSLAAEATRSHAKDNTLLTEPKEVFDWHIGFSNFPGPLRDYNGVSIDMTPLSAIPFLTAPISRRHRRGSAR